MTPTSLKQLPWPIRLNLGLLALLLVALGLLLWPHWRHNPDLSHGYFMPVLFLLLLHESRARGTPRFLPAHWLRTLAFTVALASALTGMVAAGLYATTVGWSHAIVSFSFTAAVLLALIAGLIALSAEEVRIIPFNWCALVALGLWLLCSPIPPGTYSRLTLGLQLAVSQQVLAALHFLGIAASRNGNIIELANTSVGVAEACSGVRSLLSCIFTGFFFSATLVSRRWARALIILLAAPLALVMNFVRSLLLTLAANRGIDISGPWHDVTGFAVLGVTALILGGLALLLEKPVPAHAATAAPAILPRTSPRLQHALSGSLGVILALGAFFVYQTRSFKRTDAPVPDLLAMLPAEFEGWRVKTSEDIYRFSGQLETRFLAQRSYYRTSPGDALQITVYLAYWRAGQSSVSQVASHSPDACWPGAGWRPAANAGTRHDLELGDRRLEAVESRLFYSGDFPQHVWFWHVFDGRPIAYANPRSWTELLRIAWRYGFRRDGDQLFVRLSSNQPWPVLRDEPLVRHIFTQLQPLGL